MVEEAVVEVEEREVVVVLLSDVEELVEEAVEVEVLLGDVEELVEVEDAEVDDVVVDPVAVVNDEVD